MRAMLNSSQCTRVWHIPETSGCQETKYKRNSRFAKGEIGGVAEVGSSRRSTGANIVAIFSALADESSDADWARKWRKAVSVIQTLTAAGENKSNSSNASSRLAICKHVECSEGGKIGSAKESRSRRRVSPKARGIRGSSASGGKGKSFPVSRHS